MVAVRNENGQRSLLGQYPISCMSPSLCEELDLKVQSQPAITGLFQHSADRQSLVLQSLKN
jgi:hypothetical protein